jgi:hypothetical protein
VSKRKPLPLDDELRWWPMTAAHGELTRRSGNRHLAASDLADKMKANLLPCMRRRVKFATSSRASTEADRELVPHSFWDTHVLDSWSDALRMRGPTGFEYELLRSYVFFVWKPGITPSIRCATISRRSLGTAHRGSRSGSHTISALTTARMFGASAKCF